MAKQPNQTNTIVDAVGLTKTFRDFWMRAKAKAVDGITFNIQKGELFGLLGPNGSGKSTTIKLILGLLNKTQGRLTVFGKEPHDVLIKKYIGFLPEESYLYPYLNSIETLDYYGRLYGIDRKTRKHRSEELLEMVGLSQVAHRHVGEFSKGMMRRIGLAQALINDPEFLILDEPTSGLDPIGTRQVKDLLMEFKKRGKTILLSSHLLSDVEDVCDRMTILYGGKIHAEGTADELLIDTERTVLRIPRIRNDSTIQQIEKVLQSKEGTSIDSVEQPRQTLEAFFIDIVDKALTAKSETSGAKGGSTAPFLMGDESGDAVIDKLVETSEKKLVTEKPESTVSTNSDESVILDELLQKKDDSKLSLEKPKVDKQKEVDGKIIDSLISKDSDQQESQ
jgi:ABC-2 type transport system ATP-binding protein